MFYDFIGTLASLIATYYFIRKDIKAWPASLIAIGLNSWLYYQKGIYADMCLEYFYALCTVYGWYKWKGSKSVQSKAGIKRLSWTQWSYSTLTTVILYCAIAYLLKTHTNSNVLQLDAMTTALSLVAQWLMCYKFISTWILWFFTDALYVQLYISKNLPFHSILMFFYTGLAIIGYLHWGRQLRDAG